MNCHYRPKSFLSTRVCPCYRYIWGKCNSFLLKKKIASGLLIGSFKIKLNGSFDPVATTRDSDLYKIFTISEVDLNGANFDGYKFRPRDSPSPIFSRSPAETPKLLITLILVVLLHKT